MAPTISARHADNGNDTLVSIAGASPGRHTATVRLWPTIPAGDSFAFAFHGEAHELELAGLATCGLAVVDDADELRFEVATLDDAAADVAALDSEGDQS